MKKLFHNILIISLISFVSLGLVSCNFNKKSNNQDNQVNKTESNKSVDEQKNLDTSNSSDTNSTTIEGTKDKTFNTIEDALKNSAIRETIAKTLPENIKLSAKGNDLIYTIEVKGLPKNEDSKEALNEGLKANESTFENLADTMLSEIKGKEMNITIKYVNDKNELIYEQTNNYKK